MPVISEHYREQNRQLHESRDDYGRSSKMWCEHIGRVVNEQRFDSILDYGCGKGELKAGMPGFPIAEYDPAVPGKDAPPEPADFVVCTDVLEHIEPVHLNAVIRDLARCTRHRLFFSIATTPSTKMLPDGRNAHLIVKPKEWWFQKLSAEFKIICSNETPYMVYGEAIPNRLATKAVMALGKRRRPITPEWQMMFNNIRTQSARYSDDFSRIETINMWDDMPDEPNVDMQAVVNVFNNVDDPHGMMARVMKKSRKAVLATVQLDPVRNEAYWRKFFEKYLRIADFVVENNAIVCIGSPMVGVEGIIAVGVVDKDERWAQIEHNSKRFPKRIETAPAHDKRALVACYGPSLKQNIDVLKEHAQKPDTVIVSVSGAHDFLIEHGITPHIHLECDPRPHKADNIAKPIDGVTYLLGSVVHPSVFDKLEGADIRLWHVSAPEHQIRMVDELGESPLHVISGGGSVGLRSIPVMYAMGYRKFTIFGMDCSFSDDGSEQWAGKHAGKRQELCQANVNGRVFTTSPVLMTYATGFFESIQKVADCTFTLVGDGLLQAMCAAFQSRPANAVAA